MPKISDKIKFHIKVIWVSLIARNLLGLLGLFAYPFIDKEKARENKSFWWWLLNDDELERYGVDYDVKIVKEKGIPLWFASYWFNAIRNRAYNWLQSRYFPKLNVDKYVLISGTKEAMEWKGGWAWFHPNDKTNKISARYSKILFNKWVFQYGDFGDRYDMTIDKI